MRIRFQTKKTLLTLATTALVLATSNGFADPGNSFDAMTTHFFSQYGLEATQVGIEAEFTGISIFKAKDLLVDPHVWGGTVEDIPFELGIKKGTDGVERMATSPRFKLRDTKAGKIIIKVEGNELLPEDHVDKGLSSMVTEIVTSPIKQLARVNAFQAGMNVLKANGAAGTDQGHAVSLQANVELISAEENGVMNSEKLKALDPMFVVHLLQNYYDPANRKSIEEVVMVPDFRAPYVGDLTPGLQEKMFNSKELQVSSWNELYDLLMYRQVAELMMGKERAWSLPIEDVRRLVRQVANAENFNRYFLPIVKWNRLRWSSLLIGALPDDPVSVFLRESYWVTPHPIVEFREFNQDFDAFRMTKWAVGFVQATRQLGRIRLDTWKSRLSEVHRGGACREAFTAK